MEWLIILILLIVMLILFLKYSGLKGKIDYRSRELFEDWKQKELNQIKSQFELQSKNAIRDTEKLREQLKSRYDTDTERANQETQTLREQLREDNEKIRSELYEKIRLEKIEHDQRLEKIKKTIKELDVKYIEDLDTYNKLNDAINKLEKEKNVLEEDLELISYGLYSPHFDFDTSEKYKEEMNENYKKQKEFTKNKKALVCSTEWIVSGSKVEGRKMTEKNIRLMARAFNNECDAAILKVRWNNVDKMEERIKKAFESINKLGESNHIAITNNYLKLKLEELYLTHEHQQKLQAEKEEQRRIQEQMREEQKAQKELEEAQEDAEKEEDRYQKELIRLKEEMEHVKQEELIKYQEKISNLEGRLKLAQENKEKAKSRAQLTKSGYIYIISNIGSFGEDVYKIGMTRRYDPDDRIYELGGASVPFRFDKHALIYSDNAPALELKIQNRLFDKSINLTNSRKEFFKVKLGEIKRIVEENYGHVEFIDTPEAKEYRESLDARKQIEDGTYITKVPGNDTNFPDNLYDGGARKGIGVQQKIVEDILDPGTDENKKYSRAIIPHMAWIKEQINKSNGGTIRMKIKDVAKEFELMDQNEDDIYHGLKDTLFREGIIVDIGTHKSGDKLLIMRLMLNYPNNKQK